jgi:hypothetical protein
LTIESGDDRFEEGARRRTTSRKTSDEPKIGHRQLKICVTLLLACSVLAVAARADEVIDRVVAVVSGDIILLSDVRAARELQLVDSGEQADSDPDRETLSRLVDRALMLAEVDRYAPPLPSEEAVSQALEVVRARSTSAMAFTQILSRVGLEEMHLREMLRENLRIRAYLDQRFAADTPGRQGELVAEWLAGLRRRAEIADLYAPR